MTTKNPRKKSPLVTYKNNTAWPVFSRFIRLRDCIRSTGLKDYGICISCGKTLPRTLGQAGHFIPGRHNANLYHEKGCHLQCFNCNMNLGGNTLNYMDAIEALYGDDIVEELRENDKRTVKYTLEDLKAMVKDWRARIRVMEESQPKPRED